MYFTDLHCTSCLDGMFVNTNVQTLLNAFTLYYWRIIDLGMLGMQVSSVC